MHFVVSSADHFVIMGKLRLVRVHSLMTRHLAGDRHHGNPGKLPSMNVTEAANVFVAVKVTRFPRSLGLGVRTQVDHAERTRCGIEIEPTRFMGVN